MEPVLDTPVPANVVGELGGADLVCGQRRDDEDVLSGAATRPMVVAVPGEAHCLLDVRKIDPLLCRLGRGFPGRGPPVFLLAASVLWIARVDHVWELILSRSARWLFFTVRT